MLVQKLAKKYGVEVEDGFPSISWRKKDRHPHAEFPSGNDAIGSARRCLLLRAIHLCPFNFRLILMYFESQELHVLCFSC